MIPQSMALKAQRSRVTPLCVLGLVVFSRLFLLSSHISMPARAAVGFVFSLMPLIGIISQ
jgi:hypothetical protein